MKIEQVEKRWAILIVRISTRIRKQRPDTNSSVSHFIRMRTTYRHQLTLPTWQDQMIKKLFTGRISHY